jgi:hypothetical protein
MRENRTSGSMSGEWKRSKGQRAQATAPLLDSTRAPGEVARWRLNTCGGCGACDGAIRVKNAIAPYGNSGRTSDSCAQGAAHNA